MEWSIIRPCHAGLALLGIGEIGRILWIVRNHGIDDIEDLINGDCETVCRQVSRRGVHKALDHEVIVAAKEAGFMERELALIGWHS